MCQESIIRRQPGSEGRLNHGSTAFSKFPRPRPWIQQRVVRVAEGADPWQQGQALAPTTVTPATEAWLVSPSESQLQASCNSLPLICDRTISSLSCAWRWQILVEEERCPWKKKDALLELYLRVMVWSQISCSIDLQRNRGEETAPTNNKRSSESVSQRKGWLDC